MANNLGVTTGSDATVKTTDNAGIHTPHHNVDTVSAIVPGTGATNLGKAEDVAFAGGDTGIMALAVRGDAPAATSGTDGDYEPLQVSGGHLWVAQPKIIKVNATFNRPADTTAYAANDAVANNTAAGSVTPLSFTMTRSNGRILRARLRKTDQTVATPTIRMFFFDASPTPGAGDNAAFTAPLADAIGYVDFGITFAGSDDALSWTNIDIPYTVGTVYGLLQTLSSFTPANGETFNVDLWAQPT